MRGKRTQILAWLIVFFCKPSQKYALQIGSSLVLQVRTLRHFSNPPSIVKLKNWQLPVCLFIVASKTRPQRIGWSINSDHSNVFKRPLSSQKKQTPGRCIVWDLKTMKTNGHHKIYHVWNLSHRINVWFNDRFTYIYHKNQPNEGTYYIDPVNCEYGLIIYWDLWNWWKLKSSKIP